MGRRGRRSDREAWVQAHTVTRTLPDDVPSIFVEAQQQGVPSGVHPEGVAVLRQFQELQRLAAADAEPKRRTTKAPDRAGAQGRRPWLPVDDTGLEPVTSRV
jgi:hypothetical protein